MIRFLLFAACASLVGGAAWALQPTDPAPLRPGRLPKAEQAALKPGLTLRFHKDAAGPAADARRVRLAALHVPAGGAPSPWLAPGPFVARLTGYVKAPLRGDYVFQVRGTGSAVLRINDKDVLKLEGGKDATAAVELAKNYNRLELVYTAPAEGDATARVYWGGDGFPPEPLPPDVIFSRDDEADLVAGGRLRDGRFLYAHLNCAGCHALPGTLKASARADLGMPEMSKEAPALENAGGRLQADWMAAWIADPRAFRPDAAMPRVLHGEAAGQQAADLAAYLATLKGGEMPAAGQGAAAEGEKHFGKLGCITCHHLQDPKQEDPHTRVSLFHVSAKYQPGALEAFLRQPHQHYPWIRMPDFKLDAKEAADLAAYLRDQAKGTVEAAAPGDAGRGTKLFREAGCVQCHRTEAKQAPAAAALASPGSDTLEKGCLAADEAGRGKAPDFNLAEEQRAALAAFLKTDGASLTRETPAEFSARQVPLLRCESCHRRDGGTTHWIQILEEEGQMPEYLPSLTWTGEKLRPAWTERLLLEGSTRDQRARPWLKARMPAFPARAKGLAAGLSHEHGYALDEDARPAHAAGEVAIGKRLLPQAGGFNCVMCHGVGKEKATEPFEAPGINLLDAAQRLRYDYYQRWMHDPTRVDVTTRMPRFAPDGKTTPIQDVHSGDARRQFDAIWHFIQTLPEKK